jgi:hypothetical protein
MTHATAARCLVRRLTDASDRAIVIDALTASLDEITVPLAQLLGRPHARHWRAARSPSRAAPPTLPEPEPAQAPEPEVELASALDDLRQLLARADALANATESHFHEVIWADDDETRQRERLGHLIAATAEAVGWAMDAGDEFAIELPTEPRGALTDGVPEVVAGTGGAS